MEEQVTGGNAKGAPAAVDQPRLHAGVDNLLSKDVGGAPQNGNEDQHQVGPGLGNLHVYILLSLIKSANDHTPGQRLGKWLISRDQRRGTALFSNISQEIGNS